MKQRIKHNEIIECAKLKAIFNNKKGELNVTQASIAESLGVTQGAISHYLNGQNALNAKIASGFAQLLQINVRDFSARLADELEGLAISCNISEVAQSVYQVPVISWQELNDWDGIKKLSSRERVYTMNIMFNNTYALRVSGDTMSPEFLDGDTIIIAQQKKPKNGSYVIVKLKGESAVFKQYIVDGDRVFLKSLNLPQSTMRELTSEDLLFGVVVEKIKQYD